MTQQLSTPTDTKATWLVLAVLANWKAGRFVFPVAFFYQDDRCTEFERWIVPAGKTHSHVYKQHLCRVCGGWCDQEQMVDETFSSMEVCHSCENEKPGVSRQLEVLAA